MNIVREWHEASAFRSPLPSSLEDSTCFDVFETPCIRWDVPPESDIWLARRSDPMRCRIGGSTASAILGLHKYKSAAVAITERLCQYNSRIPDRRLQSPWPAMQPMQRGFMNLGQAGEPRTRSWLRCQGLGISAPVHVSMGSDESRMDWLAITTDGATTCIRDTPLDRVIPLECKFMPSRHGNPDHDVFPLMYAVQVHLQICLLGAHHGHYVVTSWDPEAPSMLPNPDKIDLTQRPDDVWDMRCFVARTISKDDTLHKLLLYALSMQHGDMERLLTRQSLAQQVKLRQIVAEVRHNMDRGRIRPWEFNDHIERAVLASVKPIRVFHERSLRFAEQLGRLIESSIHRAAPIDVTWEDTPFQETARFDDTLPSFPVSSAVTIHR